MPKIPASHQSRAEQEKERLRERYQLKQAKKDRPPTPVWAKAIVLLLAVIVAGGAWFFIQRGQERRQMELKEQREADSLEHLIRLRDMKARNLKLARENYRLGAKNYDTILKEERELRDLKQKIEVLKAK